MPFLNNVLLFALFFSSTGFASPFVAERNNERRYPNQAGLVYKSLKRQAVAVPSPVQPGISTTCSQYYQAVSGDSCTTVSEKYGISVQNFESWNPGVGSTCSLMMVGYFYCVAGGSSPGTATSTGGSIVPLSTGVSNTEAEVSKSVSTTSGGNCGHALPTWVDANAGPVGDAQLVGTCDVTTANFNLCSESTPCSGNATWYTVAQEVSCGSSLANGASIGPFSDDSVIAALSQDYIMGELSNNGGVADNPYCGSQITVLYGGAPYVIDVVDKCAGCKSVQHIDLSPGAYKKIGLDQTAGHVEIQWYFNS